MFELSEDILSLNLPMFELNEDILSVNLPEGKTQKELIEITKNEIKKIEKDLYGLDVKIEGRITTAMCLYLGHYLAHITKSISIFDPKERDYILCVSH